MSFFDDEQKRIAEEDRHARTGGCIALVLLVVIVPPVCWAILTFTTGGNILTAHATMLYTYYGVDGILPGIPALAERTCALDREQPADYRERRDELAQKYEDYAARYHNSWQLLTDLERDTSWHIPLEKVPLTVNLGKAVFCNQ